MIKYIDKRSVALIKQHPIVDDFFPFEYSLNLYRGCPAKCIFCSANYDLCKEIVRKPNILELFKKEKKKIKKMHMIGIGGGNNDMYISSKEHPMATKELLNAFLLHKLIPFIITKSKNITKDSTGLKEIAKKAGIPVICTSISSPEYPIARLIEPGTSSPKERFAFIHHFSNMDMHTGVCYMPVIPFYNDSKLEMSITIKESKRCGAGFILFNLLTVDGHMGEYFFNKMEGIDAKVSSSLKKLYNESTPKELAALYADKENVFISICRMEQILPRMPHAFFKNTLSAKDEAAVLLGHIYYLLQCTGKEREGFKYASYSIKKMAEEDFYPLLETGRLQSIPGIGRFIEKLIIEMAMRDDYTYYEKVVNDFFNP
ncbi:radical SAM protein [Spirochaetota bacterium]